MNQNGDRGQETWQFSPPGLGEFQLTFPSEPGSIALGCSWRADGDLKDPDFDQNDVAFLCAGAGAADDAQAIVGNLTDDGTFKAEGVQTAGFSNLFKCKKSQ